MQSKKIITQLIQGDVAKAELKIYKGLDSISQKRIKIFQEANASLLSAYNEKELQVSEINKIVALQAKYIKRESRKKNFFKFTTLLGLAGCGWLLVR